MVFHGTLALDACRIYDLFRGAAPIVPGNGRGRIGIRDRVLLVNGGTE